MERKYPERDSSMVDVIVGEPLGKGTGAISAEGFSEPEAHELAHKIGDEFLVDAAGPGCCIDGRNCVHTMGETEPEPGPSVAGGPAITAYAAAEMVPGYFGKQSAETSEGRLHEVASTLRAGQIRLGAHVSAGAVQNHFRKPAADGSLTEASQTGCGASDEFKAIVAKPSEEAEFVRGTTALLLGDAYKPEHAAYLDKKALLERVDSYDSRTTLDAIAENEGENVEVLQGKHAEVLVVFNYVEGKTVDRDRLVAETGKQVFVVDMWYIDKLANAMAQGRPDAVEMESKLKHAMTAFQVATYLALCDGSHRPAILKAQEQLASVESA